jgi:hypothetical protein
VRSCESALSAIEAVSRVAAFGGLVSRSRFH